MSLVSGAYELVDSDEPDLLDAVWESATMPINWEPIGPAANVDGGLRNVTSLGDVLDYEPPEIVVILNGQVWRNVANVGSWRTADVERDILAVMPFKPQIDTIAHMDPRLFRNEPMGLRDQMLDLRIEDRLSYDAQTNTVFMNYAGMRVRTHDDLQRIKEAVDGLLAPLGKRVNSIVNYDRFEATPDILPDYLDLVRYVQERYYLKVSRYTTSGFLRLKMGRELENREVPPHVFLNKKEAEDALRTP